jgi:hypothetical protein
MLTILLVGSEPSINLAYAQSMETQGREPNSDPAAKFLSTAARKRKYLIDDVVEELNHRRFGSLEESNPSDLKKVMAIVQDMHPESNFYKVREYSVVAIRIWNKKRRK